VIKQSLFVLLMIKIPKRILIRNIQDIKQIEIEQIIIMIKIIRMMDTLIQIKTCQIILIIVINGKRMYIPYGGEIIKLILIIMKYMIYLTHLDMMIKHIQIILNRLIIIICIETFLIMIKKKNYFFKVLIRLIMI